MIKKNVVLYLIVFKKKKNINIFILKKHRVNKLC